MANVLIVKAHPLTEEDSKTIMILDAFIEAHQTYHPEDTIEILDLYSTDIPEIDADLLLGWKKLSQGGDYEELSFDQQEKIRLFNEYTEQFLASEKIVIANALWNLNIPTRLKAWFDTVNVAGKTFRYSAEGPVGLITDKKVLHIQSSGGTYHGEDFSAQYVKGIIHFIGITDFSTVYSEGADYDPSKRTIIIEAAKEKAAEIAKNF
ncbi:FMN-dependent NADH-azoreductase [Enterococcus florum]|uniref:FMN dependent NADH:quinone oxidoreductase n=1 Tax=Enterococcus florum TaxID=2480627 RepID=A0A4P5PQ13_9ENTE|nr:FMN-dependent NADH-azoreductase [Enterococcus florum]GCF95143.1 FMN-dependent NADH-azoreductase [Enterococcus florum]